MLNNMQCKQSSKPPFWENSIAPFYPASLSLSPRLHIPDCPPSPGPEDLRTENSYRKGLEAGTFFSSSRLRWEGVVGILGLGWLQR